MTKMFKVAFGALVIFGWITIMVRLVTCIF